MEVKVVDTLDKPYEQLDSRYRLVHVVSQRAKAIQEGCEPLVLVKGEKPVAIALNEFFDERLEWDTDHIEATTETGPDADEEFENLSLTPESLLSEETRRKVEETTKANLPEGVEEAKD